MHTGFAMRHYWESVTLPLLRSIDAKVIVEIGMGNGKGTHDLVGYAEEVGGFIHSIDTDPPHHMKKFQGDHSKALRIFAGRSLEVLPKILQCDVVLIDGDHNWYTVYNELLIIDQIAKRQGKFPLVILHDTGWPYGRRDQYSEPSQIPTEYRQPYARKGVYPQESALRERKGFNDTHCHALHEGGARNGVRTALEDAMQRIEQPVELIDIPGGHGLSILVPSQLRMACPALGSLLHSFAMTEPVRQHVLELEQRRIQATIDSISHRRKWQYAQREAREQRIMLMKYTNLPKQVEKLTNEIAHIKQTLSWRITTPLRSIRRIPYGVFACLKDLWTDFGEPMPRLTRYIRYNVLGSLFPVEPGSKVENGDSQKKTHSYEICVIIPSHNYGEYLEECIQSVLNQTTCPKDIIVVDDASNDETASIAAKYSRQGVRYIRGEWLSVGKARNAAMAKAIAPYLLCLDADDTIEPDYIRKGLQALRQNPTAAIAYSNIRMFGLEEKEIITPEEFDLSLFDKKNTLPTPCIFRHDALAQAGGWTEGVEHHGDWVTWRNVLALGWNAVKIDSFFNYRKHSDSMHVPLVERQSYAQRSGLLECPTTLFLALSGRDWMWEKTQKFLEEQTFPHEQIHLVILDTSQNSSFGKVVRQWLVQSDYEKHTYLQETVAPPGIADLPREHAAREVAVACASIYNRFARFCITPLALFLEDDVIPPNDAYIRLVESFSESVISVSGAYLHRERPVPVAWDWDKQNFPVEVPIGSGIAPIGGTGFGCLALRGAFFHKSVFSSGPPLRNYDQNFFHHYVLQEGMQALIDWSVECKHYRSTDDYAAL